MGSKNAARKVSPPHELERLTGAVAPDTAVNAAIDQDAMAMQRAITLVRMRAAMISTHEDVPSPCISVCVMSERSGLCKGCFRTGDEIASWSSADGAGKRRIWTLIERRMKALQG